MFENFQKSETPPEGHITREGFDRQLAETKTIETEWGPIEYAVVEPEKYSGETPVLFIGGFGQGKDSYVEEMYDLANSGRKVLFSNPRKGIERNKENYEQLQERLDISDTVLAKAAELEFLLEQENLEQVDLAGHSQGGLVLSVLSAMRPDLAQNLVLQSPQGFQGDKGLLELAYEFSRQGLMQLKDVNAQKRAGDSRPKEAVNRAVASFMKEAFGNSPVWRLTSEIPGSAKVDLAPILEDIKTQREETGVGPRITLLTAANDGLFPPGMYEEKLEANVNSGEPLDEGQGPFKYVDTWAMYARKGAGHNAVAIEMPGLLKQVLADKWSAVYQNDSALP